jgi:limonene-1,2-epoxide hydrolase
MITGATGTIALGTGDNVVNVGDTLNISGATLTGNYELNLVGEDTSVTVAAAHLQGANAASDVTESEAGAKTVTVVGALAAYSIDTTIDTLVLDDVVNSVTLLAAGQSVTGGTDDDTINSGALATLTGTLNGGTGTNTFVAADTVDITTLAGFSNFQTIEVADTETLTANASHVSGLSVVNAGVGSGTLNVVHTTFEVSTDLSGVLTTGLQFAGVTNSALTVNDGFTLTIRQAHLASMAGIGDEAGTANVRVTEVDNLVDVAEIAVDGTVTARLVDANVDATASNNLDVVDVFEVQDGRTFTLDAALATGKTITGEAGVDGTAGASITVKNLSATDTEENDSAGDGFADAIYNFANLSAGAQGAGTAAGTFSVEVAASQRLNASTNLGSASVALQSNAVLTLALSQLTLPTTTVARTVAGTGTLVVNGGLAGTLTTNLAAINTDGITLMLAGAVTFDGIFSTADPVTVNTDTDTVARTFNISGATGLPASLSLDNDVTMTLTEAQADNLTIGGAGSVVVTGVTGTVDSDYSDIDVATKLVLAADTTFTGTFDAATQLTVDGAFRFDITGAGDTNHPGSVVLTNGATLRLTAAQADGLGISGTGTVEVTNLDGKLDADLSSVTAATVNVDLTLTGARSVTANLSTVDSLAVSGDFTATIADAAELDAGTSITVASGTTLSLTAADADFVAGISGFGTVAVTGLDTTPGANLSSVTATTVNVDLTLTGARSVTANLSTVDSLAVSGDFTATIDDAAVLAAGTSITVASGATLSLTAADAALVAGISGPGTVAVTALHATPGADLSAVDATITTAAFDGNAVFTGTLDGAVVTVGNGFTMTAAANKVAGETINKSGSGKLAVTIATADSAVNIDAISGDALDSVTVTENVVFTGTLDGNTSGTTIATTVATGVTLTVAAGIASGKAINGDGNVAVTALNATAAADLSLITNTGTRTAAVSDNVTFTGNLGTFTTTVAATKTLTAAASVVSDKTINGEGNLTVTGDAISVAQANAFATGVQGVVTATLTTGALASFATLSETGNAYTITVNDAGTEALLATDLSVLGGKTTAQVTVSNAVTISGTASQLMAALVTENSKVIAETANITFTDEPTLVQFAAIDAATSGTLTYTGIADTMANLLVDAASGIGAVAYNKPMTVSDTGTLQAADLVTLSANTNQTVSATAATTISGSATQLLSVVSDSGLATAAGYNAVVTGTASTSEISAIDADTSGVITATNIADTLGNISTYSGSSAAAAAIIQNALGIVTATGDGNNDSANFSTVLKGMAINGLGGNDALTGTDFADVITGGTGADFLFGGDGADTFYFATGESPTALVASLTFDKIGDFVATEDKIDLLVAPLIGAAESISATLGGVTGTASIDEFGKVTFAGGGVDDATLSEALAAVRGLVTGAGEVAFFEFNDGFNGEGTFLYQENGSTANDMLIFLTGSADVADFSTLAGDANTLWIV